MPVVKKESKRKIYNYNLYIRKYNDKDLLDNGIENFYAILNLRTNCSTDDIKKNYKYICNKIGKLLVKSNTDNKTLAHTFDTILGSIDKAYKILINSEERKKYDEQLEKCKNNDYIEIVSPQNKYYADPQLVKDGNKTYIFFEEFDYHKGIISCATIDENMNVSECFEVLSAPYHMSFPFVFSDDSKFYMIPETSGHMTLELYEATNFPYEWKKIQVILNGVWVNDTIMFQLNGIWWLFTVMKESNNFIILYTYDLTSPHWHAHPFNNTDKLYGRMAGNVFKYNGKLIRPVQCGIPIYGYCIIFYEIIILSRTEYKEKEISRFYPNWKNDMVGTHTFSVNNGLVAFDAKYKL